jgi:ATP/maltotriose-dependent transcriptional regulator MalT
VFADEVDLARRVAQRGLAADPQYDFLFLGTYVRVIGAWARAVSGDEPGGAADDIEALLDSLPQDQPRSGEGAWLTLLADACVRAGQLDRARAALARAEEAMATHGQVYAEPLRLLVLARLQHALGEPAAVVRETLELARADATAREAFLLVGRADRLEAELFGLLDDQAPSTRSR